MTLKPAGTYQQLKESLMTAAFDGADDLADAQRVIEDLCSMMAAACPAKLVAKGCSVLFRNSDLDDFLAMTVRNA